MKKGDPPIRKEFPLEASDTKEIRAEQLLHSLVRLDANGEDVPPESQNIGSFAGYQALLESEVSDFS